MKTWLFSFGKTFLIFFQKTIDIIKEILYNIIVIKIKKKLQFKKGDNEMTVYKVFWIDRQDGFKGYTYIEANSPKEAKERFNELGYGGEIVKVRKDC